jgi:hypothetical protein
VWIRQGAEGAAREEEMGATGVLSGCGHARRVGAVGWVRPLSNEINAIFVYEVICRVCES